MNSATPASALRKCHARTPRWLERHIVNPPLGSIFTVCIAGVIFTPVSLALAPATIPVGMVWLSNKMVKEQCYHGDLDPESDDTS